jgi:hypothetical protein
LTVKNEVIFKGERLIVPEGLRTEMKEKFTTTMVGYRLHLEEQGKYSIGQG